MKKLFFVTSFVLISLLVVSQEPTDDRGAELKAHFWNKPDSAFLLSDTPEQWQDESAIILGKRIEYKVKKKSFSNKLLEHYHIHKRIKLLDNNAVTEYSEFSFGENKKRFRGMFSYETVNYYIGIKVEKVDGTVEEVEMDEAVKKKLESGNQSFAINKIAVPNLQIGDVIDYYHCIERKFPQSGFYEFSPIFYELADEYPIVKQTVHIEVLRNCYLNAKSINGAPKLKALSTLDDAQMNVFEMVDENREKLNEEEWVRPAIDYPVLKLQAYFNAQVSYTPSGYQQFFGAPVKLKESINTNSMEGLIRQFRTQIVNGYSPYNMAFRATHKYLKALTKQSAPSTDELIREGYYFLREYWYQQYFHIYPQVAYYNQLQLDEMVMTSIISSSLSKLKREHDVLFMTSKTYTREADLLFLGELTPGIKGQSAQPVMITSIGPYAIPDEIPIAQKGVTAFSVQVDRDILPGLSHYQLPDDAATDNQCQVETKVTINQQMDSLHIRSKFILTGAEKAGWDSVLFVNKIIRDDFNFSKYGKYIHESTMGNMTSRFAREKQAKLKLEQEKQETKRLELIKDKLKDYYGLPDLNLNHFELAQYGRWDNQPEMIFEVDFSVGDLIAPAGRNNFLSVGRLVQQTGRLLEEERHYDARLPYKKQVKHHLVISHTDDILLEGLEQLTKSYTSEAVNFTAVVEQNDQGVVIRTNETVENTHIKKEEWNKLCDFYKTMQDFNTTKLKIQTR